MEFVHPRALCLSTCTLVHDNISWTECRLHREKSMWPCKRELCAWKPNELCPSALALECQVLDRMIPGQYTSAIVFLGIGELHSIWLTGAWT
ncbi:hypothetical protein Dimus_018635 [Dionaea muscipula]